MADGPDYTVPHRRRREQKTDYKERLDMLKSGKPRAVVRRSNSHARVQLVSYEQEGDDTITSAFSKQLEEYGWEHHTGNLPAAYLTGYLAGTRALEEGIEEAVVDIGLQNHQHGTRIYAAVKGLIDAGLAVNADEDIFPPDRRIRGEHIDEYRDTDVAANFEEVKDKIGEA
ncbi:MAG: 50S ribosomal protein L18 [Candidatus Nanohaloarchaea archaeon]|nr:50S ribosomal protein L18 [Candidatus Nanohaloarchaea archaeon]